MSSTETTKHGNIRKCPNCGAPIGGIATKCPECGFEFVNVSANSTSQELMNTLERIDRSGSDEATIIKRKIQAIQNYPIPNTKEDIVEMLTLCRMNIESTAQDAQIRKAWKAKALQMISKSQILLKGDKDAEFLVKSIESDQAKKKKRLLIIIISAVVLVGLIIGGILLQNSSAKAEEKAQNTELTEMRTAANKLITQGEYQEALEKIEAIDHYMTVNKIEDKEFKEVLGDIYLKLVIALIRADSLEDAAMVGLEYREKLNDNYEWRRSQVFKVLVQECEAQNVDDSPLQ